MNIALQRLQNQYLIDHNFKSAYELLNYFGAVQAQDYLGCMWSFGQRIKNIQENDIEKALEEKTILRTWPMRGTLHFVPATDAKWMLKYLTPRVISRTASIYRKAELDEKVFNKAKDIVIKTLQGGKQVQRDDLYKILEENGISTKNVRGLHITGYLAQQGIICFGTREGKQQTFVLLDEWVPKSRDLNFEEALAELSLRYFTSHGPAQIQDIMWWAGLTKKEATAGLEMVKDKIVSETINDKVYYMSRDQKEPKTQDTTVFLLPAYDEYTIAYKDRSDLIDPAALKHIWTGSGFWSTIIADGKIVGTWRRELKGGGLLLQTNFMTELTAKQKVKFDDNVEEYSKFLGLKVLVERIR